MQNGQAVLAAKSCSIEVDVNTTNISSPSDGQWERFIVGRKSWKVSTSHLIANNAGIQGIIKGFSVGHNGIETIGTSYISSGGATKIIDRRGLTLVEVNPQGFRPSTGTTVDTYDDIDDCSELIALMSEAEYRILALIGYDAFGINNNLKTAIASYFHVDTSNLPTGTMRGSLVAIGNKQSDAPRGILSFAQQSTGGDDAALNTSRASLAFGSNGMPIALSPIKNSIGNVGQTFTLRFQVDGYGSDTMSGNAICKQFKVTASEGNLCQGAFSFIGNGPLT